MARKDDSMHNSATSGMSLRLSVCGIPAYMVNPLSGLFCKWAACSGEEWTVRRCKSLKQLLILKRSGENPVCSFAKNRRGDIKGVVGSLIRWGLKSDKNFFKALSALMVYSNWSSVRLTGVQRKKFLLAVNAPVVDIPRSLCDALVSTTRDTVGCRHVDGKPQPILTWCGSPSKRAPTMYGSVPQSSAILYELKLIDNDSVCDHIRRHSMIYDHVFAGIDWKSFADSAHQDECDSGPMYAGEVHFLQEPGYKLRSIASPYRLFQVASEPLKDSLKLIVQKLPWDCTHEQGRAFPIIQEALRSGRFVNSVDLSNATDYFPFEIQEIVLKTIFGYDCPYVSLTREISRARWHSDIGDISWNKGQPLGFNPSFFLFTLSHGLLLRTLLGKEWNNEFFIVGDDVVILDDILYHKYMQTLSLLGCPYSPEKSLRSSKLCEFVGKVILPDIVLPQLKWHNVSDDNFLDLARLIGPRIRHLLSRRQAKVLDVFSHVSSLVHPYGLDWSYPGSNLDEMIRRGMLLTFDEKVLGSLTGISTRLHSQLYANYGPYTNDFLNSVQKDRVVELAKTFDEKVVKVFSGLGYSRLANEYFLEGLRDIPETLFGPSDRQLPLEEKPPSRGTLLQRLSRYLHK